jgi:hypothetical protein
MGHVRARLLGLALGAGLLAGILPSQAGVALAIPLNTCSPANNTVYIEYKYGPTTAPWSYITATLTAYVKTADYTHYTVCGSPRYSGPGLSSPSLSSWYSGNYYYAQASSTFGLDRYYILITTRIDLQTFGATIFSAYMSNPLSMPERCRFGWYGNYSFACMSSGSVRGYW